MLVVINNKKFKIVKNKYNKTKLKFYNFNLKKYLIHNSQLNIIFTTYIFFEKFKIYKKQIDCLYKYLGNNYIRSVVINYDLIKNSYYEHNRDKK